MSARPDRWADVAGLALDLVVPQSCAGCQAPGTAWCAPCAASSRNGPVPLAGPVPGWAATTHEGPAGRAVVAFKEQGVALLGRPLGRLLAAAVLRGLGEAPEARWLPADRGPQSLWLVPVPARRAARRARGRDHMLALAGVAAAELRRADVPAHRLAALRHRHPSRDQVGLTREQRLANVAGTLAAARIPAGPVVVVDDVTTTGATLAEAIRAVSAAGGQVVGCATVTCAVRGGHLASGNPGR